MSKTLTYEQILDLFAKTDKRIKEASAETDRRLNEAFAETDRRLKEASAETDRRLNEAFAKNNRLIEENSKQIEKNGKQIELQSKELAETNKRFDTFLSETNKKFDETNKKFDTYLSETNKKFDETNKKFDTYLSETNKKFDETNKKFDEVLADLRANNRFLGKFTDKLGDIVESIVVPGIVDKFNNKGFAFDSISTNVEFLNEKKDGNLAEVDVLLENGKFVIAVETKTEMRVSDVNSHIKRLDKLRSLPRFKGKKIYGALSTAITKKRPVNYALEKGFYVLKQPDVMGVEIVDFPKGCSAKAW